MRAALKYPGAKWTIADWIISHFPDGYESMTYLEPFFGSGAVFFKKRRSVIETINDLDSDIVNLFRVIREKPDELARGIFFTPWARDEYKISYQKTDQDEVEKARRFLVRMWLSIGAKSSDRTGWRNNIKGLNGNVASFSTQLPSDILEVAMRLKHSQGKCVQIENQDALKLIGRHNRKNVLIYIDPPYVMSTRSSRIYKHEYKDEDHIRLLEMINQSKAKIVLSGYENKTYSEMLARWKKFSIESNCEGGQKRIETIWLNYEPPNKQMRLEDLYGTDH